MNSIEIVGDTEEVPVRERNEMALKLMDTFIDNGPDKPYTYRDGGAQAFTDHGRKLTTEREDPEVVLAMMRLAASKGANVLKFEGTDDFKHGADAALNSVAREQAAIWERNKPASEQSSPEQPTMSEEEARMMQAAADQYEQSDDQQPMEAATVEPTAPPEKPTFEGETPEQIRARVVRHNEAEREREEKRRSEPASQEQPEKQADALNDSGNKGQPDQAEQNTIGANKTLDESDLNDIERAQLQKNRIAIQDKLDSQYRHAGSKYYFHDQPGKNNVLAFRESRDKISTDMNTERVSKSVIELAASKGWASVELSGHKAFRQQAWKEAKMLGMEVEGYSPTKTDKQWLERSTEIKKLSNEVVRSKVQGADNQQLVSDKLSERIMQAEHLPDVSRQAEQQEEAQL